eukprot:21090-Heterococcus_DN1.PRE.2
MMLVYYECKDVVSERRTSVQLIFDASKLNGAVTSLTGAQRCCSVHDVCTNIQQDYEDDKAVSVCQFRR